MSMFLCKILKKKKKISKFLKSLNYLEKTPKTKHSNVFMWPCSSSLIWLPMNIIFIQKCKTVALCIPFGIFMPLYIHAFTKHCTFTDNSVSLSVNNELYTLGTFMEFVYIFVHLLRRCLGFVWSCPNVVYSNCVWSLTYLIWILSEVSSQQHF